MFRSFNMKLCSLDLSYGSIPKFFDQLIVVAIIYEWIRMFRVSCSFELVDSYCRIAMSKMRKIPWGRNEPLEIQTALIKIH